MSAQETACGRFTTTAIGFGTTLDEHPYVVVTGRMSTAPMVQHWTGTHRMTTGQRNSPPVQYCVNYPKRYGYHKPGQVNPADNEPRVFRAGVISSCDEFPPASWIEGGIQGGTGAIPICKCHLSLPSMFHKTSSPSVQSQYMQLIYPSSPFSRCTVWHGQVWSWS